MSQPRITVDLHQALVHTMLAQAHEQAAAMMERVANSQRAETLRERAAREWAEAERHTRP